MEIMSQILNEYADVMEKSKKYDKEEGLNPETREKLKAFETDFMNLNCEI